LGFEINELSGNTFSVSCLPKLLVESDARDIVVALIKELDENIDYNAKIVESVDKILKLMACKSAIKFGDSLSFECMKALILDLESSKSQYTCVHGRPCVIEYSFVELEKMFKRVV